MQTALKTYANDLIAWSQELKNSKSLIKSIDYMKSYKYGDKTFYRSHYEMVLTFYKLYGGNATSKAQSPSKQIGTFYYAQINPIKFHEYNHRSLRWLSNWPQLVNNAMLCMHALNKVETHPACSTRSRPSYHVEKRPV